MMDEEKEIQGGECTHDCSTCGAACPSKQGSMFEAINPMSMVGKVIGVVSGKGGVGKSMVTELAAVELRRRGLKVGIMDADVTGPSRRHSDFPASARRRRLAASCRKKPRPASRS